MNLSAIYNLGKRDSKFHDDDVCGYIFEVGQPLIEKNLEASSPFYRKEGKM
jgi:hypothetical protein